MARRKISLNELVGNLFNVPVPPMQSGNPDEAKPTTIRPDARAVHFYEYHAQRLGGLSMQDMMALALNAVAAATSTPIKTEFELVVDRFKHIFQAHGIPQIHAKHIIDSLGNCFPLGGMTNNDILLENYSPSVKQALADIFGVRTDWLSGTADAATGVEPIYSRDYAYPIWNKLRAPLELTGVKLLSRSLLAVTSESDNGMEIEGQSYPFDVLLFTVHEWQVDAHMKFKTFHFNGIFSMANKEARTCLQALLIAVNNLDDSIQLIGASYSQDAITNMKLGLLPVDSFENGFPSLWNPIGRLAKNVDSETEMLSELLLSS